ncbi:mechanosensitive ion channel [Mesorhizobium microcysteis]|uniref:Small-conductance mechanosensitive channel n=1 Tax=Neoaquamicrobium microcysteis TaxID=2682781 RepID=A0A5D4GZX4_9HYPH|nr:mechanosensitive ion channel domain-containing protein [Mesorhizobium microcysteis]TYR32775.1 mechanosensitive ion channel [Mesorhizobium microcysteis]
MDELQIRTAEMVDAGQAAIQQASQLAVTYSFSFIGAIILLVAGYIVSNVVERSIYAGLGRFRGFDETLRKFFSKVARYALLVLVGVTVLAQFGVQTASIIAALGAVGLAIGLALQGTLQNIAAGIMLLALRPFRVGEYIDTGNVAGTIQEIGLFATELKTYDGIYVLSPNSQLWNTPVKNFSRNTMRMVEFVVGIAYEDDIDLAQKTIRDLIASDERVLADPAPAVFVDSLADSSVNLKVRFWTATSNWWGSKLELTKATKLAIEAAGLTIPYPQSEVRYIPQGTALPQQTEREQS